MLAFLYSYVLVLVLDGDPAPSRKKGWRPPIFGPHLLWPNGCMDQDVPWYGGRPLPWPLCVRWGPSYPRKKGTLTSTQFLALVYCGQTAGWMKMPLGMEVDLGPGHIVLDRVPAHRKNGTAAPLSFWPMSIVATVSHLSYCRALVQHEVSNAINMRTLDIYSIYV